MEISSYVVEDERFPGRLIFIGETASGAKYYASFAGRREKAEMAIRDSAGRVAAINARREGSE